MLPAFTVAVTYISFFNFSPGLLVSMRACSVRVFGSREAATYEMRPLERLRITVGLNGYLISDVHVGQIFLIDVHQHPDSAGVRNHEALRGARTG